MFRQLAFMEKQWGIAKSEYEKSLRLNPNNLSAQLYLGSIADREGDLQMARTKYELVLDGYSNHNPTLMALAKVCERQRDWNCATNMLERAYNVPGNRLNTGLRLFRLLLKLGQNERALSFVQTKAELWEHPEAVNGVAVSIRRMTDEFIPLRVLCPSGLEVGWVVCPVRGGE